MGDALKFWLAKELIELAEFGLALAVVLVLALLLASRSRR